MALQSLPGEGLWLGMIPSYYSLASNGGFSSQTINATGAKIAWVGRLWVPPANRGSSVAIQRVQFRFGAVTKAGGSAMTLSLQDVSLTSGPPTQPDETQDQTVGVGNGDASFVSNTWYRSGTLSANRTMNHGELVAVVLEYDGSGRLGADTVSVSQIGTSTPLQVGTPVTKSGGTWASGGNIAPNLILETSGGVFCKLEGGYCASAYGTVAYNSGSSPNEIAASFTVPFPLRVDALGAIVNPAGGTSDFDMVLYSGTTALATVSTDGNTAIAAAARQGIFLLSSPVDLAANTTYRVAVKPTSANNITAYYLDFNTAGHMVCSPGGTGFAYSTRAGGAWTDTTTRQLMAGIRAIALDDGANAGALLTHGGMTGGLNG